MVYVPVDDGVNWSVVLTCPPALKVSELDVKEEQPLQVGVADALNVTAPAKLLRLVRVIEKEAVLPGWTEATVGVEEMLKS